MYLDNKYTKWYYLIVTNAKTRKLTDYTEKHHIIPKSLGGNNSKQNLVNLTAREHFVCHMLLTKMTVGNDKRLMHFALGKFIQMSPNQQRGFNSWEYSKIRESISIARTGKRHSLESKKKMSASMKGRIPWNKGMTGLKHSEESNIKRSISLTGKQKSKEHAANIKQSKLGHTAGMTGKRHSDETKIKMSKNMKGPRGPQTRIDNCPICFQSKVTSRHIKFCKEK